MSSLLPATLAMLAGFAGLVWGADRFIAGAAGGAKNLGISPIVIGLTIVAIGTSAPEIIVAGSAALQGSGELAIGNALGSNLANIGLVLGVTALVTPLPAQQHLVRQEGPVLLLVTALAGWCLYDVYLGRIESALMVALIPILLWVTIKFKKQHPDPEELALIEDITRIRTMTAVLWFLLGLGTMLVASKLLVWGGKTIALEMGISELVVGLTVVAIGTSLPELAASIIGALRGHHDIAIGNVFGSNVFNLLLVMPVAGLISPIALQQEVLYRDYVAVCLFTLILVLTVAYRHWRSPRDTIYLSRIFGCTLLMTYAAYFVVLMPTP